MFIFTDYFFDLTSSVNDRGLIPLYQLPVRMGLIIACIDQIGRYVQHGMTFKPVNELHHGSHKLVQRGLHILLKTVRPLV